MAELSSELRFGHARIHQNWFQFNSSTKTIRGCCALGTLVIETVMIMSGFWRKEKGSSVSRHEMTIRMPSMKTFSSLSAGWSDVAQLQYWIA